MLLIAISFGTGHDCDPFTCSTTFDASKPDAVNWNNAHACLAYICNDKAILANHVDCVLVVDVNADGEPEVIHNYTDALG
jgi:hypothetical protein